MTRRMLMLLSTAALATGGALMAAPSAAAQGAPIIWYQSVGVPTADTPCPVTSDPERSAGWTDWTSSWEQWPNDGQGGTVCTRSITWAYEAGGSGGVEGASGCTWVGAWTYGGITDFWGDFADSHVSSSSQPYLDATCTTGWGQDGVGQWGTALVLAPSEDSAQALCDTYAPGTDARSPSYFLNYSQNPAVWACG